MKQTSKHKKGGKHAVQDTRSREGKSKRLDVGGGQSSLNAAMSPEQRFCFYRNEVLRGGAQRLAEKLACRVEKRMGRSGNVPIWRNSAARPDPNDTAHRAIASGRCWWIEFVFQEDEYEERTQYAIVQDTFTRQILAVEQLENREGGAQLEFLEMVCQKYGMPATVFIPRDAQSVGVKAWAELAGVAVMTSPRLVILAS